MLIGNVKSMEKITFEKTAARFIFNIFSIGQGINKCQFCHKKLTIKNLGGYDKDGGMCKSYICLIQFVVKIKLLK